MKDRAITAALPTFQRSVLLRHAVASVLAQTWPDVVVSVFDNASTDDTTNVVMEFGKADARVRYHRHETNIGAIRNFKYAVEAIDTPFFSVFADDDVLLPRFYEQAMRAFEAHPAAMFVAMPSLEVDESGTVLGGSGAGAPYERRYFEAGEAFGRVPWLWTGWVFRREIIQQIGFIRMAAGPALDVGFIRHVSARFPGVVLPDLAALVRVHPAAPSSDPAELLIKANRDVWDALAAPIEQDPQVPASIRSTIRPYIERMYVNALKRNVISSLMEGDEDFALRAVRVLHELGHGRSAAFLRAVVVACKLPIVSNPLRRHGQRRRAEQRARALELARRFEPQRERFRRLLHGADADSIESAG